MTTSFTNADKIGLFFHRATEAQKRIPRAAVPALLGQAAPDCHPYRWGSLNQLTYPKEPRKPFL